MLFKEDSLECLRSNFEEMVLNDSVMLGLFLIASKFDNESQCPTFWGNLHAFIDIRSDDWLHEQWNTFTKEDDLSMKEKAEIIRATLIEELKDCIPDDINYK